MYNFYCILHITDTSSVSSCIRDRHILSDSFLSNSFNSLQRDVIIRRYVIEKCIIVYYIIRQIQRWLDSRGCGSYFRACEMDCEDSIRVMAVCLTRSWTSAVLWVIPKMSSWYRFASCNTSNTNNTQLGPANSYRSLFAYLQLILTLSYAT